MITSKNLGLLFLGLSLSLVSCAHKSDIETRSTASEKSGVRVGSSNEDEVSNFVLEKTQVGYTYVARNGVGFNDSKLNMIVLTGKPAEAIYLSQEAVVTGGTEKVLGDTVECNLLSQTPGGKILEQDRWMTTKLRLYNFFMASTETEAALKVSQSKYVCVIQVTNK